ncbi:MAG: hypothetical protein ACFBWO_02120 [Paracoccaceae bacterium]
MDFAISPAADPHQRIVCPVEAEIPPRATDRANGDEHGTIAGLMPAPSRRRACAEGRDFWSWPVEDATAEAAE